MVGVCITSIGLVKIIEAHIGPSHVDEYLAVNSLFFLTSAMTSYWSLRRRKNNRLTVLFEKIADAAFMLGLALLTLISVLFAYEYI